jgi:polyhydroxyalkanoate synthesis repressor PhaR
MSANETVVIKKYANRRLYNTSTSTYVTLEDLAKMVKDGTEFNVYDTRTNEDITRSVLTQIIVEEEGKSGQNLLPISFMRRLIGFYGDNMQWLVPKYLEHSMQSLSSNHDQIRSSFQNSLGNIFPFGTTLEQMSKQNLAMFERTMRMFSPFGLPGLSGSSSEESTEEASDASAESEAPVSSSSSSSPSSSSSSSSPSSSSSSKAEAKAEAQEAAEEAAFTPSASVSSIKKVTPIPTPETAKASAQNANGGDVQNKIAALQRQLSDLAKNKA